MRKILIMLLCVLFLNGCMLPRDLNYETYSVMTYKDKKYYLFDTKGHKYEFVGERKFVGYIDVGKVSEYAYILDCDKEENIIFSLWGDFWIKEDYEFIDDDTYIKSISLSQTFYNKETKVQTNIEVFFEDDDLTFNNIAEIIDVNIELIDKYPLYFIYENGIQYVNLNFGKDKNGELYFFEEIPLNEEWKVVWYKIKKEYVKMFNDKILEYEEKVRQYKEG